MISTRTILFIVAGVIAFLLLTGSMFTVHQTQQALVLQFGEPKKVVAEPGLHFKLPLVQDVFYYDARILDLDPPSQDMSLIDQRRINVDAFARYRIVDPLKFFQSVQTETVFRDRFGNILNGGVRDALGRAELADVLGDKRPTIMREIADATRRRAAEFGIEVVDVRIVRTDLTQDTTQATYNRMRSDRVAEAAEKRGLGQEEKAKIEAAADHDRTVIIAEAERQSQILRGDGEAESRRILNAAQGKDPEFYAFFRSLEAYRAAMGTGTTMVITPDSEFFKYFNHIPGK
ncbi:MAG: protease modulator HflC [Rhodospirillaceae bacterium]|nr:MAG: protease modulator HflC [Rhodospirillaceae bacterium]